MMQSQIFTPIDIYCERLDPSFWAEPLNAISNISFFIAAWFVWRLARDRQCGDTFEVNLLIALVAMIGIGSFLFHTLALRWTLFADVVPIFVYQVFFLVFYLLKVAKLSPISVAIYFVLFVVTSNEVSMFSVDWLNGSITYATALVFLVGISTYHWWTHKIEPYSLLLASAIFLLSLVFRSLDFAICDDLNVGTHFFWHLLMGMVLYFTARAYIVNVETSKS